MSKKSRILTAITAIAAACLAVVTSAQAGEASRAPRATFTATCLTAAPGMETLVRQHQLLIQDYRDRGDTARADDLFDFMCEHLMVEKWTETKGNTVTTVGLNDLLDKYLAGSAYTAAWYLGLISSVGYSAISTADTMSSHAGWTEAGPTNAPNYSAGTRPAISFSAASAGSKASSSAISYTFSATGTIKGCFTTTVSTKDGTTGILYNAVLFTGGDRAVVSTDVVNVSLTYTAV